MTGSCPDMTWEDLDRRARLRAAQYEWSRALWAQIEFLTRARTSRRRDAGELVREAWRECAVRNPALRRMLDEHREELSRCA